MKSKRQLAGLLRCSVEVAVLLLFIGCQQKSNEKHAIHRLDDTSSADHKLNEGRYLRRGLSGEPQTLDPQLAQDTFSFPVLRDIYEGLTAEDPHGRIVPGAAESWTVDDTGTIYTFKLRSNAKWSDGETTIASEFVNGLRRAVDPQTASGSSALLTIIKGASDVIARQAPVETLRVYAIDRATIRIELQHPAPFILQILSQPVAAPLHTYDPAARNVQNGDQKSVSNGPYHLSQRIPGSFIDLIANPYYWDAARTAITHVKYVNAESEATEIRQYIAGELDMTSTIPAPDLERLKKNHSTEIQIAPILGTLYLGLDLSEPPLRDDRRLRQALSMAIDREILAQEITVGGTPAYSFVSKGISDYLPPEYDWSEWSRERKISFARTLYSDAGYSEKRPLHLTLYFNSGETVQRLMVAIAANWKQNLGVDTKLVSDEFRVFLAGRRDHSRWDVARFGWYADYDDASSFLEVFSRDNSQNDPGYRSVQFNELLSSARNEADTAKRELLLQKSEKILLDDYPIIPVYFYAARRLVKPYLRGAEITPLNHTYSKHLFWGEGS